ncbi:SDR family NAD(P)-dependent oxidoreductase [Streptomyces sp. WI04-05B]|uniref:SDR family NAD(P)-dependent oxidoreductase n=1 Tax=Streptomyces TaxID=1883 RepID=UPI0029AE25C7|nr:MULTISPECIES: SDR family NAD(P)-dependent oxidoreductase [unclassified Streptomyces]MDX2549039.1 SDR family NAD(P)-dependent oxidoreductase [Streptomyces sp. WI04-05B]MDX2583316.1 SDR family NAD(P)-dependent oxidoreductase [Streptomyces sp. WI04-05A]
MALRNAVMAALLKGEASGYDLAKAFDATVANFWMSTPQQLYRELSARVVNGMHNEDAVGFTIARRVTPNRPYRVTFTGGVHGPGGNAYCRAAMPRLTQACVPWLRESPCRGCVANVASRTFFAGAPGQIAYVAGKGALIGMTRVMARELGEHRGTISAVAPAQVATAGTRAHSGDEVFAATLRQQSTSDCRRAGSPPVARSARLSVGTAL